MLIKMGAEADIHLIEWYGKIAVSKVRKAKGYIHPLLDREMRKRRTVHEAEMINMAKRMRVTTPLLYFVDPLNAEIVMQYIKGQTVKDLIDTATTMDDRLKRITEGMGVYAARLHSNGIIHGDLTTSNFLVSNQDRLVLIDFGLAFHSTRVEDAAVDVRLIKEVMSSAHSHLFNEIFNVFMEGYRSVVGESQVNTLLRKVREIEMRGRYARVI
jgi:TP53 regulating kinase-like protein